MNSRQIQLHLPLFSHEGYEEYLNYLKNINTQEIRSQYSQMLLVGSSTDVTLLQGNSKYQKS